MARKEKAGVKRSEAGGKARGKEKRGSRNGQGSAELVDHSLMKALAKPIRARIMAVLAERVASPSEIAEELGEDLSAVSYHVRILLECGMIELDRKEPRRGAVEHFYRCRDRTLVPPGTWSNLPKEMKAGVSLRILQQFFDDARESMEAGTFDDPVGELSWTPLILDRQGMEEVRDLAHGFLKSLLEVQEKAGKRLPEGEVEGLSATAFLACFPSARSPKEGKRASATKRR